VILWVCIMESNEVNEFYWRLERNSELPLPKPLPYQMPLREQIGTVKRDKEFQSHRSCPLSMSCLSEDRKFVQSVTREATTE